MAISSAGIGSGLDVAGIVNQLLNIERAPIRQLQTEAGKLQTQISAFGRVQSSLSTLRDASVKLTQADTWRAAKATSSDTTALGATATGAAQSGSYSISVTRLAVAQTLSTSNYGSASNAVGSGILRIDLGDYDSQPPVPKTGSSTVEVVIEPGQDSLSAIRDKINNAGAGVVASVVNDVSGARLVLRSSQTGLENGFRVQVLDDDGSDGNATGLSALAFDPSNGVSSMSRPQQAQNALASINGVAVESATNTMDKVIEGLSFQLRKVGTTEVQVEPDTDALKKSVDDFVKAYNESIKLLREQTRYDPTTKQAGPLQGDRSGAAMLSQLRSMFTGGGGNSAVFSRLSDVGLDLDTDGMIKVNDTKLSAALVQGPELQKLFANVDNTTLAPQQGFAKRFESWLKLSLDSDGTLDSRTQSLQARVKNNTAAQERLEDRVGRTEQRLLRQYTALDTRMGQLSGLASYVSQQMTMLNNTNNR